MAIKQFSEDNPRMQFAIAEAKLSLPEFFESLSHPTKTQEHFLVKVRFEISNVVEHVWLADIGASDSRLSGTVANETKLSGVKFMDRVEFLPEQISDWMYVDDGYLVGGYTIQVIRDDMTQAERAAYDTAVPYKFKR